jgi:hypothetical protein
MNFTYLAECIHKTGFFGYTQDVHLVNKYLLISLLLSIVPLQSAKASEPWIIKTLTDLTMIDQFDSRELGFEVSITDKLMIQSLNNPGTDLIGSVVLFPVKEQKNSYTCYNPKPSAIAGNTGGSALRPIKAGDESLLKLTYKCWFPIGMKINTYSLNISLGIFNNGVGNNTSQMFLFGDYPDSMRPTWMYQPSPRVVYSPPRNVTVQNIPTFPIIEVVRSEPKTSPDALTFNSKNLVELTKSFNDNLSAVTSLYNKKNIEIRKVESEILSTISQTKRLLASTRKKENIESIKKILAKMNLELIQVKELSSQFATLKPGSLDNDIKRKYLFGIDFDVIGKPEILVAQYPDVKNLKSTPTPYLRFLIKSKTAISFAEISLLSPGIGGPVFSGNISLPGNFARNDQLGGGLALVENQQWDGSMFITSLLIGPRYTPLKESDITWMRLASCSTARFEDAAGNSSDLWLGSGKLAQSVIPSEGCLPSPSQAISAANDFDNLVDVYNDLAQANERFQKLVVIPEDILIRIEALQKFSKNVKKLKSTLSKFS